MKQINVRLRYFKSMHVLSHTLKTVFEEVEKHGLRFFIIIFYYPALACPVTRALNTASVTGRSLVFINPRILLQ